MFAVDRDDLRAGRSGGAGQQFAGQHQRFLVGQQQALAGACGGQGGGQPGGAHDGGHDGIAGVAGGQCIQGCTTGMRLGGQAGGTQAVAQRRIQRLVGDHRVRGLVGGAQRQQCIDLPAGGEHAGVQPVGVAGDHVQCRSADRAGRAEHGDLAGGRASHA